MWRTNSFAINFLSFICFHSALVVWCFNFSPTPYMTYKVPNSNSTIFIPKVRSSYFGYSIVLREKSLFVGAPRAQTVWEKQRKIQETGLIYKCQWNFNDTTTKLENQNCFPFPISVMGDTYHPEYNTREEKSKQFLGASLVGGSKETDLLMVCAPLFSTPVHSDESFAHGICYFSHNTTGESPHTVSSIKAFVNRTAQISELDDGIRFYNYMFSEQGFSAHITPNNKELLLGAPGVSDWGGSIVRHNIDTHETAILAGYKKYNSYFGYAVTSGYLDSKNRTNIIYIMTSPHIEYTGKGVAKLFEITEPNNIETKTVLNGAQYGEFFGYAALVEDINGDDLDDVLITAPLYSVDDLDVGAVYVFINSGQFHFRRRQNQAPFKTQARFGTAISKLGDINRDGYADIAVGAPFVDGHGAVVIYLGGVNGLQREPSQILGMEPPIETSMFGHALSLGVDIDGNGFPDLAIGAPEAETVYVYRSYPVVDVKASILSEPSWLEFNETFMQIEYCFSIATASKTLKSVALNLEIELDLLVGRITLPISGYNSFKSIVNATENKECRNFVAYINFLPVYIFSPIQLEMKYQLVADGETHDRKTFCENCAVMASFNPKRTRSSVGYLHGYKDLVINVDLKVRALDVPKNFILGTSKVLLVSFLIENFGERAYNAKFEVTTSMKLPFSKIPTNCVEEVDKLSCKLVQEFGFAGNVTFRIGFDVSEIMEAQELIISAMVKSSGKEKTPKDNLLKTIVDFKVVSNLDIEGVAKETFISTNYKSKSFDISYNFQIQNNGPSTLYKPIFWVFVPAVFINENNEFISFVNLGASYASIVKSYEYLPQITFEKYGVTPKDSLRNEHIFRERMQLPDTHTISLNCDSIQPTTICAGVRLSIPQLNEGHNFSIAVTLNIQSEALKRILLRNFDYLELFLNTAIQSNFQGHVKVNMRKLFTPEILVSFLKGFMPLWMYIAAVTCGFCILALIVVFLYKLGFFKRLTKKEMLIIIDKKIEEAEKLKSGNADLDELMGML